ncbi:MAG: hypothetical protein HQK65_22845 [Desulfamplus sp.]|nr:hypothetical protein [Desulfamplus sp.]
MAEKSLFSISKGSYFSISGSNGTNSVIIESGARALFNTFGNALYDVTIKSSSFGYKICSAKYTEKDTSISYFEDVVYIEHSNGTRIEITASEHSQTINFADSNYQLSMRGKNIYLSSDGIKQRIKHKEISLPLLKQMESNQQQSQR